jgi:hypothetical protein
MTAPSSGAVANVKEAEDPIHKMAQPHECPAGESAASGHVSDGENSAGRRLWMLAAAGIALLMAQLSVAFIGMCARVSMCVCVCM